MSIHRNPRNKSPFWYACFTLPNGRRTMRSTKHTDKRKAEAVCKEWQAAAKKAREGTLQESVARKVISDLYEISNAQPLVSSKVRTFLAETWLKRKKLEVAHSTYIKYADVVQRFLTIIPERSEQDIGRVSTHDILRFRQIEAHRVSAASTNHSLKILRMAFRDAFREGFINLNPAERVSSIKVGKAKIERRPFNQNELSRLLDAAAGTGWEGMIYFGYYTGQRLGDIATLTWQNVNTVYKQVSFVDRKTDHFHQIPLGDELLAMIEKMPAGENPSQPLFPKAFAAVERNKGRTAVLSNQFYDLMAEAGLVNPRSHSKRANGRKVRRKLNEISFHCIRHTTTTALKSNGTIEAVAKEFVGHESTAISKIYTHLGTDTLRKAVESLPPAQEQRDKQCLAKCGYCDPLHKNIWICK